MLIPELNVRVRRQNDKQMEGWRDAKPVIEKAGCRFTPEILIKYPDQLARLRHRFGNSRHHRELAILKRIGGTLPHRNGSPHLDDGRACGHRIFDRLCEWFDD